MQSDLTRFFFLTSRGFTKPTFVYFPYLSIYISLSSFAYFNSFHNHTPLYICYYFLLTCFQREITIYLFQDESIQPKPIFRSLSYAASVYRPLRGTATARLPNERHKSCHGGNGGDKVQG